MLERPRPTWLFPGLSLSRSVISKSDFPDIRQIPRRQEKGLAGVHVGSLWVEEMQRRGGAANKITQSAYED